VHTFLLMLLVPLVAGVLGYVVSRLRNEFSFIGAVVVLYYAVRVFIQSRHGVISYELAQVAGIPFALRVDALSGFVLLCVRDVCRARCCSSRFATCAGGKVRAASSLLRPAGAGLLERSAARGQPARDALLLGVLLVWLYGLLLPGGRAARKVAAKALVIVGLSDFAMLLGIVLVAVRYGWIDMAPTARCRCRSLRHYRVPFDRGGRSGQGRSMPLHSWISLSSQRPLQAAVMAYIPASLDKLLGTLPALRGCRLTSSTLPQTCAACGIC